MGILALQNTENGLLNAEFVDFSLFAGLFYGSLRSFFAWLGFLARCFLAFTLCFKSDTLNFEILRIFGICDEF